MARREGGGGEAGKPSVEKHHSGTGSPGVAQNGPPRALKTIVFNVIG